MSENRELLEHEEDVNDLLNAPFSIVKSRLQKSTPGKDDVGYIMSHLSESSKVILLELYNKVWEDRKLPQS